MKLNTFYWALVISVLLNSCNYRTPSKDRFEKITKISLPNSINVTYDRFEESGPDYGLFYKVSLNQTDCLEILDKIEKSNEWIKKSNEWTFNKTIDGIIYNISFSVKECQITYDEILI